MTGAIGGVRTMFLGAVVRDDDRMTYFFEARDFNRLLLATMRHVGYDDTKVIYVDAAERAAQAPKQGDLFKLLIARVPPLKYDDDGLGDQEFVIDGERVSATTNSAIAPSLDWHRCTESSARKLLLNILENPKAKIETLIDPFPDFTAHLMDHNSKANMEGRFMFQRWWPHNKRRTDGVQVSSTDPVVGEVYWDMLYGHFTMLDPRWDKGDDYRERAKAIDEAMTDEEWDRMMVDAYFVAAKAYRRRAA
jgi:hypothetical protein